ncbi:MAG TPA: hypothetical protein VM223_05820 [Planctomycetota bacterium]|nr:hypothetical protein [Planctomycetota bacterium]
MTTISSSDTQLVHCAYHQTPHPANEFSGTNRYCRVGLNEYRRSKRQAKQVDMAAAIADGAPLCPVCRNNPILRQKAKRCKPCINAKVFRCSCGRKAKNTPYCGRCCHRMRKQRDAERRLADLNRGLRVFTGNAVCKHCNDQLRRDPAGNVAPHVCKQ